MLDLLDSTAAAGGTMIGQTHTREFQSVLSFETTLPFDRLPEWRDVRAQPLDAQRVALRDPDVRARLVDAAARGGYARAIGAEARPPDYDWIRVFDSPTPPYRTVADIATERGIDPALAMIDIALEHDLDQFFLQPFGNEDPREVLSDAAPSAYGRRDVRHRRARVADHGLVDPDPSPRVLGA